jgi:hypothetical protein
VKADAAVHHVEQIVEMDARLDVKHHALIHAVIIAQIIANLIVVPAVIQLAKVKPVLVLNMIINVI